MEEKWFERILAVLGVIALCILLYLGITAGKASAATVCQIANGCTGTSTAPAFGDVLVGNSLGTYNLTATSSLGFPIGGSGTVTSVAATTPNSTLSVGGSPITTSGTLTFDLNLTHSNWWTALQSFGNATTSGLEATSTNVFFDGFTSTLLTTNSSHQLTAYAGTSCTNQFVRSINGAGVATCNTVSLTSDVTGVLQIANGGTNEGSFGTSNGIVAYNGTGLVNFSAFTLTSSLLTASNASTTNLTAATSLGIPTGSNPTPIVNGYIAQSTNAPYQLHIGNNAGGTTIIDPTIRLTLSSPATTTWSGTTTIPEFPIPEALTWTSLSCTTFPNGATVNSQYQYANPSTYTTVYSTMIPASNTPGTYTLSSNNVPAAHATSTIAFGTPSGSPQSASCTLTGTINGI